MKFLDILNKIAGSKLLKKIEKETLETLTKLKEKEDMAKTEIK